MTSAAILAALALAEATNGIPPGLLTALCTVESGLNPDVIHYNDGKGDSLGLCQIKERTARAYSDRYTAKRLLNPAVNAQAAGAHLARQFARYGTWQRAVVSYNRGSSTGGSNRYSRKVLKEWANVRQRSDEYFTDNAKRTNKPTRSGEGIREANND